jgi:hypothetical protein
MTEVSKLYAVTDSMGTFLMKVLREEIVTMRTLWAVTPKQHQDEILERIGEHVDNAVRLAVRKLLSGGQPSVTATLQKIVIKEAVQAILTFDRGDDALSDLTHLVGTNLVLVLADPGKYAEGVEAFEGDADQNPLPLGEP